MERMSVSKQERKNSARGTRPSRSRTTRTPRATHTARTTNSARSSHATPARRAALQALDQFDQQGGYIRPLVQNLIQHKQMSSADKAFAQVLALGVVTYRGVLDELINGVLKSPDDIKDNVRRALQIATYELYFLDKSAHAAVDQGVELVRFVNPRAAGVANFVMRRLSEKRPDFPFGNPEADLDALSRLHGFPSWLAKRLIDDLGRSKAEKLMAQSNKPAALYFMINTLRVPGPQTCTVLAQHGFKLKRVESYGETSDFPTLCCDDRTLVSDPLFSGLLQEGAIIVSDWAAQQVVQCALPKAQPRSMLEIGAGRGTKTVMIQTASVNRYGMQIELDCLDLNKERLEELTRRTAKGNVSVRAIIYDDATKLSRVGSKQYDVVFIDAPCSGTGTLDKHPEIRWRITSQEIGSLAALQRSILNTASTHVAPGGRLVYATCSALTQENQDVIDAFLATEQGASFAPVSLGSADHDSFFSLDTDQVCDAHFCSVLVKN